MSIEHEPDLIRLEHVSKVYGMGEAQVVALDGIDLTIETGEFVAVLGPSGSGKSTAMNILGCLDTPTSGQYFFRGIDVGSLTRDQRALLRRNAIGFVFQGFNLLKRTSALENLELPLIYRGAPAADRHRLAREALHLVGLDGREKHSASELSGGQQQRVAIARALVSNPDVIFADEPTGNLDSAQFARNHAPLSRAQRGPRHHHRAGDARGGHCGLCASSCPLPRRAHRIRPRQSEARTHMIGNAVALALREIRRNLMRAALTTLGIVIGVGAVIAMVTLGNGAQASITSSISALGRNLLIVTPGSQRRGGPPSPAAPFTLQDADMVARDVPGLSGRRAHRPAHRHRRRRQQEPHHPGGGHAGALSRRARLAARAGAQFHRSGNALPARRCASSAKPCARICSARRIRWARRCASARCRAR